MINQMATVVNTTTEVVDTTTGLSNNVVLVAILHIIVGLMVPALTKAKIATTRDKATRMKQQSRIRWEVVPITVLNDEVEWKTTRYGLL